MLEARRVGAVTTGNTTGKVSLLQGTQLSAILRNHSRDVAQAYVDGNWRARRGCCGTAASRQSTTTSATHSPTPAHRTASPRCVASTRPPAELGLAVEWQDGIEPPIPCTGAVRLRRPGADRPDAAARRAHRRRSRARHDRRRAGPGDRRADRSGCRGATSAAGTMTGRLRGAGHRRAVPRPWSLLRQGHPAAVVRHGVPGAGTSAAGHVPVGRHAHPIAAHGAAGRRGVARGGRQRTCGGPRPVAEGTGAGPDHRWTARVLPRSGVHPVWSAQDYASANCGAVRRCGCRVPAARSCWRPGTASGA